MRCIFMAKKKIAYIQFPGSNTENETKNILQKRMSKKSYWRREKKKTNKTTTKTQFVASEINNENRGFRM